MGSGGRQVALDLNSDSSLQDRLLDNSSPGNGMAAVHATEQLSDGRYWFARYRHLWIPQLLLICIVIIQGPLLFLASILSLLSVLLGLSTEISFVSPFSLL